MGLVYFNVGVELGQLLFIAAVGLLMVAAKRTSLPQPSWGWRVPAYSIGTIAAF